MMLALDVALAATVFLLALATFAQVLYLESMRLRTRDLPSLKFFKETLEDKIGLSTEQGAGSFSLVKHTLVILLALGYYAEFEVAVAGGAGGVDHHGGHRVRAAAVPLPAHLRPLAAAAGAAGPRAGVDRPGRARRC